MLLFKWDVTNIPKYIYRFENIYILKHI